MLKLGSSSSNHLCNVSLISLRIHVVVDESFAFWIDILTIIIYRTICSIFQFVYKNWVLEDNFYVLTFQDLIPISESNLIQKDRDVSAEGKRNDPACLYFQLLSSPEETSVVLDQTLSSSPNLPICIKTVHPHFTDPPHPPSHLLNLPQPAMQSKYLINSYCMVYLHSTWDW